MWGALRPLINILGEWVSWFGPLNSALLALGLYLGSGLIKAVAGLAIAIAGPMLAAFAGLFTAVRAGGGVMAAFNAVLLANPIGLLLLAVTALGASAYLIVKYWEPIKAFFSGLWEGVKAAFNGFVAWLDGWTGGSATTAVNGITAAWGGVVTFFGDLWGGVKAAASAFTGWLASTFVPAFGGEAEAVMTVWRRLPEFFSRIWDDVSAGAAGLPAALAGTWTEVQAALGRLATWLDGWTGFSGLLAAAQLGFSSFATWLDGWTGGALTGAYDAIKGVWEGLPAFFTGLWDRVKASFDAVWGWISPIIERIERVFSRSTPEAGPAPSQPAISPGPDGQPRTVRRGTVNGARRFDDQAPDVAPNVRPITPASGARVDVGGDLNIRVTDDRVEVTGANMNEPRMRVRASNDTGQVMALP